MSRLGEPRVVAGCRERPGAVAVGVLGIEVVDDEEIEVGDGGHLARPELAHGHDRHGAAGNAAVLGFEIGSRPGPGVLERWRLRDRRSVRPHEPGPRNQPTDAAR